MLKGIHLSLIMVIIIMNGGHGGGMEVGGGFSGLWLWSSTKEGQTGRIGFWRGGLYREHLTPITGFP